RLVTASADRLGGSHITHRCRRLGLSAHAVDLDRGYRSGGHGHGGGLSVDLVFFSGDDGVGCRVLLGTFGGGEGLQGGGPGDGAEQGQVHGDALGGVCLVAVHQRQALAVGIHGRGGPVGVGGDHAVPGPDEVGEVLQGRELGVLLDPALRHIGGVAVSIGDAPL